MAFPWSVKRGLVAIDAPQASPLVIKPAGPGTNISMTLAGKGSGTITITPNVTLSGALDHDGATVGFYGTAPIAQQTGVAVTAGGVHAALVALGLITA